MTKTGRKVLSMKSSKKKSGKAPASRPAPPPKRTGKRGIGLRDSEPPEKEREVGSSDESSALATNAEPVGELVDTTQQEGSLLAEQPPKPVVVGDRIEAHFLKPTFSRTAKGKRLVSLHITFPLTEEHTEDGLLPDRIRDDFKLMTKHGRTKLELNGLPGQRVCFFLSSDAPEDDPKLVLPAAEVSNVSLAVVQKKGDGEAKKVVRLSFRFVVPVTHEVGKFAEMNYGVNYWIKMEESQDEMFNEDDDE